MTQLVTIGNHDIPVRRATSRLAKTRGFIMKPRPDYGLLFDYESMKPRTIHMLGVPFSIDAVFIKYHTVHRVVRLAAWTGVGRGECTSILELPAGEYSISELDEVVWPNVEWGPGRSRGVAG